jgi:hypothetical protein
VVDRDGYQPGNMAWSPDRSDICELLRTARHRETHSILYGSNTCYLVLLDAGSQGCSFAVYKPARGEYPLWDFPQGSLYRREVASFRLDHLLGWNLIPPTIVTKGRYGVGSLQLFIEEYPQEPLPVAALRKMALLDCVLNNADRKTEHLLVGAGGHLWGIDHGLTFHVQPKLRTVLWHFAGLPIEKTELADLEHLRAVLESPVGKAVHELLDPAESRALLRRLENLIRSGHFPNPRYKAVPYRW